MAPTAAPGASGQRRKSAHVTEGRLGEAMVPSRGNHRGSVGCTRQLARLVISYGPWRHSFCGLDCIAMRGIAPHVFVGESCVLRAYLSGASRLFSERFLRIMCRFRVGVGQAAHLCVVF